MTSIAKTLLAGSAFLSVVLIWLSNAGLFPLSIWDFAFLFLLSVLAALYRPGWMFLGLVSVLPLEVIDLAPEAFRIGLRPYQVLEAALLSGLLGRAVLRRPLPDFPKPAWFDVAAFLIPLGSVLSISNAPDPAQAFKLSLVLCSLFGLYVISRIYLRSSEDVARILPFVFVSGLVAIGAAIFENIRFLSGLPAFELMPGRPDALFPEPDWLGLFLVAFFGVLLPWVRSCFSGETSDRARAVFPFAFLALLFMALLISVARSAWLGALSVFLAFSFSVFATFGRQQALRIGGMVLSSFGLALLLVSVAPLTRFDLFGRAASTGGFQEITVSCGSVQPLPEKIADTSELSGFGCRHIDLEEIGKERMSGRYVSTVKRLDPNIEIRKDTYAVSTEKLMEHPLLGIGWGSIGFFLGSDPNGSLLNASNMFLEIWLGSGLLGFLGFLSIWISPPILILGKLFRFRTYDPFDAGLLAVWAGITVANLFNSGVLLGFFWVFLAALMISFKGPGTSFLVPDGRKN